jgi:hypothetical protein
MKTMSNDVSRVALRRFLGDVAERSGCTGIAAR